MLIIGETGLRTAMAALVGATHESIDVATGRKGLIRTVDELTLRNATLAALQVIAGEPVVISVPQINRVA